MATVVLAWVVIGGALLGLGLVLRACMVRGRVAAAWDHFAAFWLGLALVVCVLHIVHFFVPMLPAVGWAVLICGWGCLALRGRDLVPVIAQVRERKWLVAACLLGVVWVANRAIGPGDAHDSGLYHFNVIRWSNTYPIVPGLANLSGPLGMNQSSLLLTAAFNHWPIEGRAHHVVNSLLVVALMLHVVPGVFGVLRHQPRSGPDERREPCQDSRDAFAAALLPVVVMLAVNKDISSPKTDLAAGVVLLAAAIMTVRGLTTPGGQFRGSDWLYLVLSITASCALTPCLKLSTAPAALGLWFVAVWMLIRSLMLALPSRGRVSAVLRRCAAPLLLIVLSSTLLVGPWMARSAVLSGYLLFPTRLISIPVEWKVPADHVAYLKDVISKHGQGELPLFISAKLEDTPLRPLARLTRPPFDTRLEAKGTNWVRAWFFSQPFVAPIEVVLPASLAILLAGMLARRRTQKFNDIPAPSDMHRVWLVLAPAVLGILAWFLVAPVGRYAWPLWWMVVAVFAAMVWSGMSTRSGPRTRVLLGGVLGVISLLPLGVRMGMVLVLEQRNPLSTLPLYGAGADSGFHPVPTIPLGIVTTRHGVEVWAPMPGHPELVWDSPLPACPWPPVDLDLALRVEGQMAHGFMIARDEASGRFPPPRHVPEARSVDQQE